MCSNSSSGGRAGKEEDQPCGHSHHFLSSTQILLGELAIFNHVFVEVENLKEITLLYNTFYKKN
jgi:hypothetical protein